MTRPFDFKDVEAALKRAAWKAVHGTREERSGRFTDEPRAKAANEGAATPFVAEKKPKG